MTGVDIVERVSKQLELPPDLVSKVLKSILNEMTLCFENEGEVKLIGYGTFKLKVLKNRKFKFGKSTTKNVVRLYVSRKSKWKNTGLSKNKQKMEKK